MLINHPSSLIATVLVAFTLTSKTVTGQTLAQDCATANTVWQKMGGDGSIPSNCCNTTAIAGPYMSPLGILCSSSRIVMIEWFQQNLKNSIPSEFGKLTGLTHLALVDNELVGPIPTSLNSLVNLRHLYVFTV
jgi:hypothetical protein